MGRGRQPAGPEVAELLEGSAEAKRRVQWVLATVAGRASVPEACRAMGIGEARFFALRRDVLQAAVERAEPKAAGRPPVEIPAEAGRAAELETEIRELKLDLEAARVKTEIAIALPHLLKSEIRAAQKKTAARPAIIGNRTEPTGASAKSCSPGGTAPHPPAPSGVEG